MKRPVLLLIPLALIALLRASAAEEKPSREGNAPYVASDVYSPGKDVYSTHQDVYTPGKDVYGVNQDTYTPGKDVYDVDQDTYDAGKDVPKLDAIPE